MLVYQEVDYKNKVRGERQLRQFLTQSTCFYSYFNYNTPMRHIAAMVCLFQEDKMLFLVRKKQNDSIHKEGIYLPIGGHIEEGESFEDCARREVKEESGIEVLDLELRGILHGVSTQNGILNDWLHIVFVSRKFKGSPQTGNEGSFSWVSTNDFDKIPMYEAERQYINDTLNYKFFVAEWESKDYELIKYKLLEKVI